MGKSSNKASNISKPTQVMLPQSKIRLIWRMLRRWCLLRLQG